MPDERDPSSAAVPPHLCGGMHHALSSDVLPFVYGDTLREYGVQYQDGGTSFQALHFCPFCGARLPDSVRREWFNYFWDRDLNPREHPVPPAMQTGQWWREAGL